MTPVLGSNPTWKRRCQEKRRTAWPITMLVILLEILVWILLITMLPRIDVELRMTCQMARVTYWHLFFNGVAWAIFSACAMGFTNSTFDPCGMRSFGGRPIPDISHVQGSHGSFSVQLCALSSCGTVMRRGMLFLHILLTCGASAHF